MPLRIQLAAIACVALASLAAGTPAPAAEGRERALDFCPNGAGRCAEIRIVNEASVSARLAVRQRPGGPNACAGAFRRRGNALGPGEDVRARVDSRCIYVLRFDPGPGCDGDLRARLGPRKMANGHRLATLSGPCGALAARTRVPPRG
jgi:hypothetical protein